MEIRSTSESKENAVEFAKRYLNLLKNKQTIDEDIKALKAEFQENGVACKVIIKAITEVRKKKKQTDSEVFELEQAIGWIQEDKELDDKIVDLMG